jgi:hypothetical protein
VQRLCIQSEIPAQKCIFAHFHIRLCFVLCLMFSPSSILFLQFSFSPRPIGMLLALYKFKKQNGSPNIPEEHERRHTDEL